MLGWILTGLVVIIFLGSGIMKISGGNPEMAQGLGGESNMMALGILEVVMVGLFLYSKTGVIAFLLMVAYLGGAMAVHLTTGQSIVVPTIIQIFVWLVGAYRFPELLQRLKIKQ